MENGGALSGFSHIFKENERPNFLFHVSLEKVLTFLLLCFVFCYCYAFLLSLGFRPETIYKLSVYVVCRFN